MWQLWDRDVLHLARRARNVQRQPVIGGGIGGDIFIRATPETPEITGLFRMISFRPGGAIKSMSYQCITPDSGLNVVLKVGAKSVPRLATKLSI